MRFLKEQFNMANRYIKEHLLKLFCIFWILFIALCAAYCLLVCMLPKEYVSSVWNEILQLMDAMNVADESGKISCIKLIISNIRASAFTYLYGFIPFLFLPVISVIVNSVIVGLTVGAVGVLSGESVLRIFLTGILPHGIFELSALILCVAGGVKLCLVICKKALGKNKDEKISSHLKGFLKVFIFYIIPLLIVAGIIEAVILPMILM